ncbi:MAG: 23S rRNA (adenine(2503)-C(2))-methyltransferase RlmN [Candidatus Adiutrix sp.]
MTLRNILDFSLEELEQLCQSLGEKPYRSRQLATWIFKNGVKSFEEMTDISKKTREKLNAAARLTHPQIVDVLDDDGGAKKILWSLDDGLKVESVLINEKDHLTLCVSSQVGCALGCRFCRTGTMGFSRNLSSGEIIGQLLGAQQLCGQKIRNLVFMGMGEPLLNRPNITKSLFFITSPDFLAISTRHISISTVGIVPEIELLSREHNHLGLTISISAANDKLRNDIMPINKKYPLAQLKEALKNWPLPKGRRLTVAYVLLGGVNDSPKDAKDLSLFLSGLKTKINLIPFNPWPGAPYHGPTSCAVEQFKNILIGKNYTVMVRRSMGRSAMAACGQLYAENLSVLKAS